MDENGERVTTQNVGTLGAVHNRYSGLPFGTPAGSGSIASRKYAPKLEESKNGITSAVRTQNLGEVKRALLKFEPEMVNLPDIQSRTAVHHAAYRKNLSILETICKVPCVHLNAQDEKGWAPLRTAVEANRVENVEYLLMHSSADPTCPSKIDGLTPLEVAKKSPISHKAILEVFERYMNEAQIVPHVSATDESLATVNKDALTRVINLYPSLAKKNATAIAQKFASMVEADVAALSCRVTHLLQISLDAVESTLADTPHPLATRLQPVKEFLDNHVQQLLRLFSSNDRISPNFRLVYLQPALTLMAEHAGRLIESIKKDKSIYRNEVLVGRADDKDIYEATHSKTLRTQSREYNGLIQRFHALAAGVKISPVKQPVKDPVDLVVLVQSKARLFGDLVRKLTEGIEGVSPRFRGDASAVECKSLYRIIEKAMFRTKINLDQLDCSGVLDVYGCVIECEDYRSMNRAISQMFSLHESGDITICRVKDRYSTPTSFYWRDYMINVVVDSVVFELQIVLKELMSCRKVLHGHSSFARMRCFVEAIQFVGETIDDPVKDSPSSTTVNLIAENKRLSIENEALRAQVKNLEAIVRRKDELLSSVDAT